jgi:hypothetical protein
MLAQDDATLAGDVEELELLGMGLKDGAAEVERVSQDRSEGLCVDC